MKIIIMNKNLFSAEGKMEASKPEDTETEGAEDQVDYGPWTARKRFRAEYVLSKNLHTFLFK